MILSDFVLPSRINQFCLETGIDSIKLCPNKHHFKTFKHAVSYQYNSRGYRDIEWPTQLEELNSAIWCVGDSFTVGVGNPFDHIWPQVLQQRTSQRVINVSMDGASNEWIARRAIEIFNTVGPCTMIVMWSYFHRRELIDITLDDEQRRLHVLADNSVEWYNNSDDIDRKLFLQCLAQVNHVVGDRCIHFVIPNAASNLTQNEILCMINTTWNNLKGQDWPKAPPLTVQQLQLLPDFIKNELQEIHDSYDSLEKLIDLYEHDYGIDAQLQNVKCWFGGVVPTLDLARDSYHFGIDTSNWVVDKIQQILVEQQQSKVHYDISN